MWIVSKNRAKIVKASSLSIENGNDIVVEGYSGNKYQMGNYDSLDECLQIVENYTSELQNNARVYYLPKSKNSFIEGL